MYRFLIKPRWVAFGLFVVVMVVACLLLARWQLDRLESRNAYNAVVVQNIDQAPVSPAALLSPGEPLAAADLWRSVAVSGRYDPDHVLLVRKRVNDGQPGFYVLTPFRGQSGVGLWLNRGWIPAAATATSKPEVPPTPAGTITVVARMRFAEAARGPVPTDLPPAQIDRIDVPRISEQLSYPAYGGYGEVITERPQTAPAPQTLAPPNPGAGPHLSYAVQWVTFALVAVVGGYVLVRKEAEHIAEERAAAVAAAGPDPEAAPRDTRTSVEGNA